MSASCNGKLRVAIAGYGVSGRLSHAEPILKVPGYEICAVCDVSPERRKEAESQLGCATYTDYREMLEAEGPDLFSVVTRSDTHCEMACHALRAGVHTLVTKPWALNLEEGYRILDARRDGTARLYPWIPMFWSPDLRRIREIVRAGAIGEVFFVRRYITHFWRRDDWQTRAEFGGGYLLNWGAHIIQPVMELAASPVRRVFGTMDRVINPGDAEDHFMAYLEFENGVRGVAEFTQALEGLPMFLVQGTRGMIASDEHEVLLLEKNPGDGAEAGRTRFPHEGKLFGDEVEIYRDVAADIRGEKAFPLTAETALEGTRIFDAIRQSHLTQSVVAPEEIAAEYRGKSA